jgi:hydroxymethylpyrimidine/phosphomethylpyrimidine kinase
MPHDHADPRVPSPACCLTIAGSDSGGGAGIQADLKTFAALGVHGTSAITALTAQNTQGVTAVHPVPARHLRAELDAVFDDFRIAAVKTGMLGDVRTVRCVARELARRKPRWLVVDPVMIATSGARLLDRDAVQVLIERLIPLADVLTPNLPEAEALTGITIRSARDATRAGATLRDFGAGAVLLKGGHGRGREVVDRWFDARGMLELRSLRLPGKYHGTGCTLSSALAAELAKGAPLRTAVRRAIAFGQCCMRGGFRPGRGNLVVLSCPNAIAQKGRSEIYPPRDRRSRRSRKPA